MNGFEIFLCILAGIILLIVGILSIPVHVSFSYEDKIFLSVRYLFLKFRILPQGEKKEKKPKKEKKKKEKPKEEPKEEAPKEKKPNPLLNMVKANGYDGMMEVLRNLGSVLARYGSQLFKSVIFDEFDIYVVVGKGDAAATAIEYGKACQRVYPLAGFLCSNNVVHKYDVSVESDFLAGKSAGEFFFDFHLVIRKILNATIAMVVRMLFKVLLKFLKNGKPQKTQAPQSEAASEEQVSEKIQKG